MVDMAPNELDLQDAQTEARRPARKEACMIVPDAAADLLTVKADGALGNDPPEPQSRAGSYEPVGGL